MLLLLQVIHFVPHQEEWIVELFGKYSRTLKPVSTHCTGALQCRLHTLLVANNGQGEGVEVHACYSTHKENSCLIGASCFVIQKNSCLVPLVSYLIKNLPDTEHSLRSNDKGRTFDHKKVFSFTNLLL